MEKFQEQQDGIAGNTKGFILGGNTFPSALAIRGERPLQHKDTTCISLPLPPVMESNLFQRNVNLTSSVVAGPQTPEPTLPEAHQKSIPIVRPFYSDLFKVVLRTYSLMLPNPRNSCDNANSSNLRHIVHKIFHTLKWIYFLLNTTFLGINAFVWVKLGLVPFSGSRQPDAAFATGYLVVNGLIEVYFIYLLFSKLDSILHLDSIWKSLEADNEQILSKRSTLYKAFLYAMPLISLSYIIFYRIGIKFVSGPLKSIPQLLRDHGCDLLEDVTTWNSTLHEDLFNSSPIIIYALGLYHVWIDVSDFMLIEIIDFFIIAVILGMHFHVAKLDKVIQDRLDNNRGLELEISCWQMYRKVKNLVDATNESLTTLFGLFHCFAFVTFARLVEDVMDKDSSSIRIFLMAANLVQRLFVYFLAAKVANTNTKLLKWMRRLPTYTRKFLVGNVEFSRSVMMEELKDEPLGVRFSEFIVNGRFIAKFTALAISIVIAMVTYETPSGKKHG